MLATVVLALLGVLPTYGPVPGPRPTAPPGVRIPRSAGEALIANSGSTNTAGYTLRVYADGTTELLQADIPQHKRLARTLVDRFFADLRAAGPLNALPHTFCMKSASFGTTTTISYRGKTSPDVSCPGRSVAARTLASDASALAAAAGIALLAPRP
ncbi:MAG TPA: hypothetical protein VE591_05760 [Candidatus Acidoferrum sp.]|jgi:hypothetical protein|nr:hypothetical protein [Candidatus Acidoferrum sp.]